jgi:hypothetical protein
LSFFKKKILKESQKVREDEEDDGSSYWIALCGELALEEAIDLV